MFLPISLVLLLIISYGVYVFCKRQFSYWRIKGIDCLNPTFPFGDMGQLLRGVPPSVDFAHFYQIFKSRGQKHGGVYQFFKPTYLPVDPQYVKDILIKDFQYFTDRGLYFNEKDQPILRNLFFIKGADWRSMRCKLSPAYTAGKMKMMFKTMLECSEPLVKAIGDSTRSDQVIDIKEASARFTTDVIGSCALGIECNSFESPNSEFRMYGRRIFEDNVVKSLKGVFRMAFPQIANIFGMLSLEKAVEEFFVKAVTDTYHLRRKYNVRRNDFMQLLIELKDKGNNPDQKANALSMEEVIAQAFIFFIAGFDTSATTLTFALCELAYNEAMQTRLREEINGVLSKYGDLTYDSMNEMKYLDRVIQETLRKYPPVAIINRVCTDPYKIPATDIVLDKDTQVAISVLGLHRDPEFYPDPDNFDPERFSEENKTRIVPGTYIPFGDGPRICIGLRFGLMQVKIGLVMLLKDYEFTIHPRTKMPLEIDFGFVMNVKGGIWLSSRSCR